MEVLPVVREEVTKKDKENMIKKYCDICSTELFQADNGLLFVASHYKMWRNNPDRFGISYTDEKLLCDNCADAIENVVKIIIAQHPEEELYSLIKSRKEIITSLSIASKKNTRHIKALLAQKMYIDERIKELEK